MGEAKRRHAIIKQIQPTLRSGRDFESYARLGKLLFTPAIFRQFNHFVATNSHMSADYWFASHYGQEALDLELPDLAKQALCFPPFFSEGVKIFASNREITDGMTMTDLVKAFCCASNAAFFHHIPHSWLESKEPTVGTNEAFVLGIHYFSTCGDPLGSSADKLKELLSLPAPSAFV